MDKIDLDESDESENEIVDKNKNNLNKDQQESVDSVINLRNTFITGPAGTGKSFLIKTICQLLVNSRKLFAILAPTGVAAVNIGGQTIHRFLSLRPVIKTLSDYIRFASKYSKINWKSLQVIIIDEISMVQPSLFKLFNQIAQFHRNSNLPFGGIQVILLGDFYQLNPIIDKSDVDDDGKICEFVFETKLWLDLKLNIHILSKIMRQDNTEFIEALNDLRVGNYSPLLEKIIVNCSKQKAKNNTHYVKLYALNAQKNDANDIELAKLNTTSKTFIARDTGNVKFLVNCPATPEIVLKIDCPVMLLKNMPEYNLFNGSIGVVVNFENDLPMVKFNAGPVIPIEMNNWTIHDSSSEFHKEIASRTQLPLAVAYSLTVHKVQGLGIDFLVVDVKGFFCAGQVYVALSRAINDHNLIIKNFNKKAIMVNQKVVNFYKNLIP